METNIVRMLSLRRIKQMKQKRKYIKGQNTKRICAMCNKRRVKKYHHKYCYKCYRIIKSMEYKKV